MNATEDRWPDWAPSAVDQLASRRIGSAAWLADAAFLTRGRSGKEKLQWRNLFRIDFSSTARFVNYRPGAPYRITPGY